MKLLLLTVSVFSLLFFNGCEGEAGKAGRNFISPDIRLANVDIVYPISGSVVYDDVVFEAYVQYQGNISHIDFLINGNVNQEGLLTVREKPYYVVWDSRAYTLGRYFVQAMVWDERGRSSLSPVISVIKGDPSELPEGDTIRFFNSYSATSRNWRLPNENPNIKGYGTRFLIKKPSKLSQIGLRLYRAETWRGEMISIQIRSAKDGQPDSLIHEQRIDGTRLRLEAPETYIWSRLRPFPAIDIPMEFFITMSLAEERVGDTMAIVSDDGLWRNWHGYINQDDEWREFTAGSLAFNPLIYLFLEP